MNELNSYHRRVEYVLDKDNTEIVERVYDYFMNPDIPQGVILMGSVGSGKTTLMKMFADWYRNFGIISCKDVVIDFNIAGFAAIEKHGNKSYKQDGNSWIPLTRCFDELGSEEVAMLYGNRVDVMATIIEQRYNKGLKTHFTTNYDIQWLSEKYGARVASRIMEMSIPLILNGKDRRRI